MLTCAEFDSAKLADYGAVAFGCPAMGAEQLEEGEFEPMFADLEGSLSGVRLLYSVLTAGALASGWKTGAHAARKTAL